MWRSSLLESILRDLRLAVRQLRRSPGVSAVTLLTLMLSIGATTALFTVVSGVLLRSLPFPDAERLVMVWERPPESQATNVVSTKDYVDWKERNRSFVAMGALRQTPVNVSDAGDAEQLQAIELTADVFTALGAVPVLGRMLRSGEDVTGGPKVVVLSHGFWQRRYGGKPGVLGQTLSLDGRRFEIVGIMGPDFTFPGLRGELFMPLGVGGPEAPLDGTDRSLWTVARLRPQVSLDAARADMEGIAAQIARERPRTNAQWGTIVTPLLQHAVGDVRPALLMLFAAVIGILLVACVNVANLLGMRAQSRAREMSVRVALGAGRWRLIQQLLTESLVLAGLGGALGFLVAWLGVPLVIALFPPSLPLPRTQEIRLDGWVLAWTFGVSVGAGILFGLLPAMQVSRRTLSDAMHAGARTTSPAGRVRALLVVTQVTLAVMIVVAAGLMVRTLVQLYRVDLGFRVERVLAMRMLLLPSKYLDPARRVAIVDAMVTRVRTLPNVVAASSIQFLPLSGQSSGTHYYRLDREAPQPGRMPMGSVSVVSPGYFRTMGIPIVEGRDFGTSDTLASPRVVAINRALATQLFPGESPMGKRLHIQWGGPFTGRDGPPEFEIVALVANSRHDGLRQPPVPTMFLSHAQEPNLFASLVVRTTGDPLALAPSVRQAIREVDPEQGVSDMGAMETMASDSIARQRIQTILLGTFGVVALLLACVGLYGVLAYAVQQRRREIGVRLVLGATAQTNLRLVLGEGLRLTLIGVVLGLIGAAWLTRFLETLLYEVRPLDPVVFALVAAGVIALAVLACVVPARRAMRVNAATVLRED